MDQLPRGMARLSVAGAVCQHSSERGISQPLGTSRGLDKSISPDAPFAKGCVIMRQGVIEFAACFEYILVN